MTETNAQTEERIKRHYQLSQKTAGWFEGFAENLGGNEFTYESIREDVNESLLVRATNGKMAIQWVTEAVPMDWKGDFADFLWIAAMDKPNVDKKFFMYVNNDLKFTFTNPSDNWEIATRDGGKLGFSVFMNDRHGDGHGYMTLHTPADWIEPGKGLNIKIIGEATGSNTWCIVYQAKDAISYLRKAAGYEGWFDLEGNSSGNNQPFLLRAPGHYTGETFHYNADGQTGTVKMIKREDFSEGTFTLTGENKDLRSSSFSLYHDRRKLFGISGLFSEGSGTDLRGKTLVMKNTGRTKEGGWLLKVRILYNPKLVESLKKLSESKFSDGKILLMNSSHQDIAWMDSPEKCVIERDTMLLSPLLNRAILDPDYRFDIEDVLMIREFIERHPDKKAVIQDLLHEGKLTCGSTYIMPYEEMYSGESLVRQFYLGAKWMSREFKGYRPDTYWNVDVPGRTLQMAQVARKAGTEFMVISRHKMGMFNWYSPDGSYVTTYSPGHYSLSYPQLQRDFFCAAGHIASHTLLWEAYQTKPGEHPVAPILSDWDMSPARNYNPLLNRWHNLKNIEDENGNYLNIDLPEIQITTAREFMKEMVQATTELPAIRGERPAVWVYIHGPSHQKALKASREGDILLTVAEKFSSIDAALSRSFSNYPRERLTKAWEAKIYPDHGWGGKNGEITDALFTQKFEFAREEATRMVEIALRSIASKIKTKPGQGIPVIVFNSLSWERSDPVSFHMTFDEQWMNGLTIHDKDGKNVRYQMNQVTRNSNGNLKSATINLIADDIPSIGYKTYYLIPSEKDPVEEMKPKELTEYENEFYRVELTNGGIMQIYDKNLKKNLLDPSNLKGGEVFTMKSEGHGAGEFTDVQQPSMENFDKVSNYPAIWLLTESGEIFNTYSLRKEIRNATIEQNLIIYHDLKRIDIEVSLLNWEGVLYREYRMAIPLDLGNSRVAYEVPFGVVEVGKDELEGAAGERYTVLCKDIHPRGIGNWIGAYNNEIGVTLSSSVAVADYIDPTGSGFVKPVLQPILLASRKSCHGEGNDYLQTGDHHYSFSIYSHKPGWENGYKSGTQANEKLMVVVNPQPCQNANLPEEKSFLSLDKKNVIISTLKKSEDDNSLVVRIFEIEGRDVETRLRLFFNPDTVELTNIIEEDGRQIPAEGNHIPLTIGKYSIETYKLSYDF